MFWQCCIGTYCEQRRVNDWKVESDGTVSKIEIENRRLLFAFACFCSLLCVLFGRRLIPMSRTP